MGSRNFTVTLSVALIDGPRHDGDEAWAAVTRALEQELADFAYREESTGLAFQIEDVAANLKPEARDFRDSDQFGSHSSDRSFDIR